MKIEGACHPVISECPFNCLYHCDTSDSFGNIQMEIAKIASQFVLELSSMIIDENDKECVIVIGKPLGAKCTLSPTHSSSARWIIFTIW